MSSQVWQCWFLAAFCEDSRLTLAACCSDLGILTGHVLKCRNKEEWWKFQVFLPLFLAYLMGGLVGGWAVQSMGWDSLWLSFVLCGE